MNSTRPFILVAAPEDLGFYVESSIPPGLTLSEYRRSRAPRAQRPIRRGRTRLLRRLAGA
jgi:hypothetical protein